MPFSLHSDRKVAELRATGRIFKREYYPFGEYPTYAVLDAAGNEVGVEYYAYVVTYADDTDQEGRLVETIFTSEADLIAHVLDVWRPADRAGQDAYCRLAADHRARKTA